MYGVQKNNITTGISRYLGDNITTLVNIYPDIKVIILD